MKPKIEYDNIPIGCNYLYAIDKSFLFYKNKLSKKDKKLINAKLIWKRKKGKDEFAIDFAEWIRKETYYEHLTKEFIYKRNIYESEKELLEIYKKEKEL